MSCSGVHCKSGEEIPSLLARGVHVTERLAAASRGVFALTTTARAQASMRNVMRDRPGMKFCGRCAFPAPTAAAGDAKAAVAAQPGTLQLNFQKRIFTRWVNQARFFSV
mgnify:CR=1 FL=1